MRTLQRIPPKPSSHLQINIVCFLRIAIDLSAILLSLIVSNYKIAAPSRYMMRFTRRWLSVQGWLPSSCSICPAFLQWRPCSNYGQILALRASWLQSHETEWPLMKRSCSASYWTKMSSRPVHSSAPVWETTQLIPWNASYLCRAVETLRLLSNPASDPSLIMVLTEIQKLVCKTAPTSLRERKILGCTRLVLRDGENITVGQSGLLHYAIHGWRSGIYSTKQIEVERDREKYIQ